jgi:hypothetical protein
MQFLRSLTLSAEIPIVDDVLDEILFTEDINDMVELSQIPGLEYVVRKHVRGVIKCYLESFQNIHVKDETTLCIQLTSIGLHLGMPAKGDNTFITRALHCNVVVMAILAFTVVAVAILKPI